MKHQQFQDEKDSGQMSLQIGKSNKVEPVDGKDRSISNSFQIDGQADASIVQNFTKLRQTRQLSMQASLSAQQSIKSSSFMERGANIAVGDQRSIEFAKKLSIKNDTEQIQELMQQNKDDPFANFDDHRVPLSQLMGRLKTDPLKGITEEEATRRNLEQGDNKLTEKKKSPWWFRLIMEMINPFALMLWIGSFLCIMAYVLQPDDLSNLYLGGILMFVVILTGLITFQQQAQSEALMNSFKNFLPQSCNVIRDGILKSVLAEKLVCGDIIEVQSGNKIPADFRVLQCREMRVDNSCLTGEAEPQLRSVECSHPNDPLETKNLAFFGTLVKEGNGRGVVIRIGDLTVLGQIANLASSSSTPKTPLRQELDRFVIMITIIALILGFLFFICAWLIVHYDVLQCVVFGIGILVANVPEGLLGCITISLAITAKRLSEKMVLVKNLEAVETLGSTSCICSDKTGTLTQNKMTVENIWYDVLKRKAHNKQKMGRQFEYEYDTNDPTFKCYQECAMITSSAVFNVNVQNTNAVNFLEAPTIGDATETALIKFFQPIEDIETTRSRRKVVKLPDDSFAKLAFNSTNKFALTIVEYQTADSNFCVYVKGAPEKVWTFCNKVLEDGKNKEISRDIEKKFDLVNEQFANNGERVLGFAQLHLQKEQYPLGFKFNVNSPEQFNFPQIGFTFLGLVSLIDPPKDSVAAAVMKCHSAGIKVIMVTGDQPATAAAIARQVNIISEKTVDEVAKELGIDWEDAYPKANAIVIHGEKITRAMEEELLSGIPEEEQDKQLMKWCQKPQIVFARTTPAQKLKIVKACQKLGYIVGVTGDGVNDSPAIKQGDIGISMGISGSDVTKDAADMILLNDDFASIVDGIQEGRKIFDNLKKTIVYLLTSNCTEIIPFIAMVLLGLPLPLSSVFMLVICVGTDILPALSLAYEDAELDIMTRKPRTREEHLVSRTLLVHSYLLMGWIATSAGFIAYFATMEGFGFTPFGLIGLNNMKGYSPVTNSNVHAYDETSPYLGNANLNLASRQLKNSYIIQSIDNLNVCKPTGSPLQTSNLVPQIAIDWLWINQAQWDLRNVIVDCGPCSPKQLASGYQGQYCYFTSFQTNACSYQTISPISGTSGCYSTEALKYSQSAYFVAVVVVQWSNIFACKCRKSSLIYSCYNKVMMWGILVETVIAFGLCYTPGVQLVFGGRPHDLFHFGVPGLPYSMMLLIWEEFRKYLIRNVKPSGKSKTNWFERYSLW